MSAPVVSTAVLLTEDRHLMPRCVLRDRLRLAPSDRVGASAQPWRPPADAELQQLTGAIGAGQQVPDYALFSVAPALGRRLAAAWQVRDAAAPPEVFDDDLIADLVDFFAFIDAPVQGVCSVRMDRIDEQGINAGFELFVEGSSHLARINAGPAEAALLIGPVGLARGQGVLVRVELAPGEGVFVRQGTAPSRLNAGPEEPALVVSVLPQEQCRKRN